MTITTDNILRSMQNASNVSGRLYVLDKDMQGYRVNMVSEKDTILESITFYGTKGQVWSEFQSYLKGLRHGKVTNYQA